MTATLSQPAVARLVRRASGTPGAAEVRAARRRAGRRPPRAQLPGPGDPGRRRPRRRLARAVPDRRGQRRRDDRLRRRALHGRDGQDPGAGEDGAGPGREGRLLAGRHDHRRPAARVEGRAPRRRRRRLREHDRRGEGRDRHLLHVVQRGRGRRVDPGRPRGAVPARPVPRRARPAGHRAAPTCASGWASATCTPASPPPTCGRASRTHPDAELLVHPECGCATSALWLVVRRAAAVRARARALHRRHARRRPGGRRRSGSSSPPRSACCTSCARPTRSPTSSRSTPGRVPVHEDVDARRSCCARCARAATRSPSTPRSPPAPARPSRRWSRSAPPRRWANEPSSDCPSRQRAGADAPTSSSSAAAPPG